jgi:WD40 repeat protein
MSFTSSGDALILGDDAGDISIWSINENKPPRRLGEKVPFVSVAAYSSGTGRLVVAGDGVKLLNSKDTSDWTTVTEDTVWGNMLSSDQHLLLGELETLERPRRLTRWDLEKMAVTGEYESEVEGGSFYIHREKGTTDGVSFRQRILTADERKQERLRGSVFVPTHLLNSGRVVGWYSEPGQHRASYPSMVWDLDTRSEVWHGSAYTWKTAVSMDGSLIASELRTATEEPDGIEVLDVTTGQTVARVPQEVIGSYEPFDFAIGPSNDWVAVSVPGAVKIVELAGSSATRSITTAERPGSRLDDAPRVDPLAVSPNGRIVAGRREKGLTTEVDDIALWDSTTGSLVGRLPGVGDRLRFSDDSRMLVATGYGAITIWRVPDGQLLATVSFLASGAWSVTDPSGRFDASDAGERAALHWIVSDEPLRPVPLESFMKEYYEPGLLKKILHGEKLRPVPALEDLNRIQPEVVIEKVEPSRGGSGTVDVTVKVRSVERSGKWSGAEDLKLFRDGQLVRYAPTQPGPLTLDPKSHAATISFNGIPLPTLTERREVDFSAYAFNVDGVKSTTVHRAFIPRVSNMPPQRRAYVMAVGVNVYDSPAWNLNFAVADAQAILEELVGRLRKSGRFEEVVAILLVSDRPREEMGERGAATKVNVHTVLDALAGKQVSTQALGLIPNGERLRKASPDDTVLISFDGHGYADIGGNYFLFPADIGPGHGKEVTSTLLQNAISGEQLREWLRDVDAGEMDMIIGACQSGAAVGEGFRPGPLSARGLGQLAYDKGMRILAAAQPNEPALEGAKAGLVDHGYLAYALVEDGLKKGKADYKSRDQRITLSEWLSYGAYRVPRLLDELQQRASVPAPTNAPASDQVTTDDGELPPLQQPVLFDFANRKSRDTIFLQ